jgi:hypothetical protein
MTTEMIEKFIENKTRKDTTVKIHFKERSTVTGLFVHGVDYAEFEIKKFLAYCERKLCGRMEKD